MSDWRSLLVELKEHEPSFALIEQAREGASRQLPPFEPPKRWRGRIRLGAAIVVGAAVIAGVLLMLALAAHSRSSNQPAHPPPAGRRPPTTPVRLSARNGPLDVYGYVGGGVRGVSKTGWLGAFTVRCPDCSEVRGADWSGDGKLLVYNASCAFGGCQRGAIAEPSHGIRVFNPTTGADRRIVYGDISGSLSVSADGSRIVYTDGRRLRIVPTDGSTPPTTIITGARSRDSFLTKPTWSPDGKWIAFAVNQGVYTIAADGTNRAFLAHGSAAAWSPDGRWIAYLGGDGIHLVAPDGTGDRRLAQPAITSTLKDLGVRIFTVIEWSPDGRKLALMVGNQIAIISARTGAVQRRLTLRWNKFWFPYGVAWRPVG